MNFICQKIFRKKPVESHLGGVDGGVDFYMQPGLVPFC